MKCIVSSIGGVYLIVGLIHSAWSDWTIDVCLAGRSYNISKYSCGSTPSVGIWFAEPLRIDRASFSNGVWAVYREWCEPITSIWTVGMNFKTPGCMEKNLLEKVAGIVFLGSEIGGVTVATSKQRLFFGSLGGIPGEQRWTLDDPELSIISWGPTMPYTLYQSEDGTEYTTCLMGGRSLFKQYKFNASIVGSPVELSLRQENCTISPKSPKPLNKKLLPLPQTRADLTILQALVHLTSKESTLDCRDLRTCFKKCDRIKSALDVVREVNEQSARLALKFQGHVFNNHPLPDHNLQQWKLLETSKKLLGILCPNQIIPTFFLDKISVLAEHLLSESVRVNPRGAMDPGTFVRIQNILQSCIGSAKPFVFSGENACTNDVLIQVDYLNGTKSLAPPDLPEDMRNNVDAYDLIIEATWKIFLFAHYTCAKYFHEYPSDLSVFYSLWLEMITRDLQERWTNPGKSFQLMQLIFRSIDLSQTVKNLDYCVGAAQAQSVYSGWLKRPFQVKVSRKLIVTKDLIWDGNAYSMDSYAYPAIRLGYPINKCGVTWD